MERWSAADRERLYIKTWQDEDEAVAYHGLTGDTHLLGPLQTELIQRLQQRDHSIAELFQELAELFHADEQEQALEFMEATLLQLRDLGLVSSNSL
jgi:PqqD family protein of HPr-rel-A system